VGRNVELTHSVWKKLSRLADCMAAGGGVERSGCVFWRFPGLEIDDGRL
jgi:hypothetical protein